MAGTSMPVTDGEVLGFVRDHAEANDLADPADVAAIGLGSSLTEIGLDSIGVAELLLNARQQLVAAGRLDPDATLLELPPLETVADLGDLLRSLDA